MGLGTEPKLAMRESILVTSLPKRLSVTVRLETVLVERLSVRGESRRGTAPTRLTTLKDLEKVVALRRATLVLSVGLLIVLASRTLVVGGAEELRALGGCDGV